MKTDRATFSIYRLPIVMGLVILLQTNVQAAGVAMIAYGKSGSTSPCYRSWDGSAWGAEGMANSVGSLPQWIVLRGSPVNSNFILTTLDDSHDIEWQEWNGTNWSPVFQATDDAGTKDRRVFDMAYEQVSGQVLLVYREQGTTLIRYRTYDGAVVSGEMSYAMTTKNVRWLQLVPKRGTDEIMVIAIGDDDKVHKAALWDGSAFTNQVDLVGIDEPGTRREHADGAFEGLSGQGLVAYNQDSNSPAYRTLVSAAWSSSLNAPSVGGKAEWTRLVNDPISDKIIMATLDQAKDINMTVWSGNAWGTPLQIESNVGYSDRRAMDVTYEPQGSKALVAYEDNTNTLKYRTWDGFSWSVELPGPTGGSQPLWNPQTVSGLSGGQVFVTYGSNDGQIRTIVWDGSSFGPVMPLGPTSGNKEFETFMVATSAASTTPKLTIWREIQP